MAGPGEREDRNESRRIAITLILLLIIAGIALVLMLPMLDTLIATHFSPGLGLKPAAGIAFIVTMVVMVVFAVAAGDGLLGELQFMLGGFFSFFLLIWLMLAWIF